MLITKHIVAIFTLFAALHNTTLASSNSKFETQAYSEIANFLGLELSVVKDQQALSEALHDLIPVGTIKSEALDKLKMITSRSAEHIKLEWELERNPCGVSIVFMDSKRGFGIKIAIILDKSGKVERVRTGEFSF